MKSDDASSWPPGGGDQPHQEQSPALLGEQGLQSHTFLVRADTVKWLRAIGLKEGCDQADALALAVAKYHHFPAGLSGLSPALVEDLEILFPEADLPNALATAAQSWINELKKKRSIKG